MTTTELAPRTPNFYLESWKRLPRELAYLLVAFPLALTAFVVTITLIPTGVGTIVVAFLGVLLVVGAFYVARGFGTLDITLLEWTGREAIPRPDWRDDRARAGFFPWLGGMFGNPHYWMYLAYSLFIAFPVALISWTITVVWVSVGLGGVTYWIWSGFGRVEHWRFQLGGTTWETNNPIFNLGLGLVILATLPLVTRGLLLLHCFIARWMLGGFPSETSAPAAGAAPEVAPESSPEVAPESSPEVAPVAAPEPSTEVAPEAAPEASTGAAPERPTAPKPARKPKAKPEPHPESAL